LPSFSSAGEQVLGQDLAVLLNLGVQTFAFESCGSVQVCVFFPHGHAAPLETHFVDIPLISPFVS
jgi:hypothetical protein